MINNIATSHACAIETHTAENILPSDYKTKAKELMVLIESYYEFLNKQGGPSHTISNLTTQHDIALADDEHLIKIEQAIAKNVPKSKSMDRRRLLSIIADYYTHRGSEASIHAFFKIFYDEIVQIIYPKEFLFDTSGEASLASDRNVIRDSYKWQEYSYVLNVTRTSSDWKNEFLQFIHPAGLKFFVALSVELFASNDWNIYDIESYLVDAPATSEDIEIFEKSFGIGADRANQDDWWMFVDWMRHYVKNDGYDDLTSLHTPYIQSNAGVEFNYLFQAFHSSLFHYLTRAEVYYGDKFEIREYDFKKTFLNYTLNYWLINVRSTMGMFHYQYITDTKFIDQSPFGSGYQHNTIAKTFDEIPHHDLHNRYSAYGTMIVENEFVRSYTETPVTYDDDLDWIYEPNQGSTLPEYDVPPEDYTKALGDDCEGINSSITTYDGTHESDDISTDSYRESLIFTH